MPNIKMYVHTNTVGSTCEDSFHIDDEEWKDMTASEQDELIFEMICDSGQFEWGWEIE